MFFFWYLDCFALLSEFETTKAYSFALLIKAFFIASSLQLYNYAIYSKNKKLQVFCNEEDHHYVCLHSHHITFSLKKWYIENLYQSTFFFCLKLTPVYEMKKTIFLYIINHKLYIRTSCENIITVSHYWEFQVSRVYMYVILYNFFYQYTIICM